MGRIALQADAVLQNHPGFARGFLPGGGTDEASQMVSDYLVITLSSPCHHRVITDSPGPFTVLPGIHNDGTLTSTPAIDRRLRFASSVGVDVLPLPNPLTHLLATVFYVGFRLMPSELT